LYIPEEHQMKSILMVTLLIFGAVNMALAEPRLFADLPASSVFASELFDEITVKNGEMVVGEDGVEYVSGKKCRPSKFGYFSVVQNLEGFIIARYFAPSIAKHVERECPSMVVTTFSVSDVLKRKERMEAQQREQALFKKLSEPIPKRQE
jgi:hypothetical protein